MLLASYRIIDRIIFEAFEGLAFFRDRISEGGMLHLAGRVLRPYMANRVIGIKGMGK